MAYYFENRQYGRCAAKLAEKLIRNMVSCALKVLFMINSNMEARVKAALLRLFNKFKMKGLKRSKKLSNDEVEKWVAKSNSDH
jgi:hypothetical protein